MGDPAAIAPPFAERPDEDQADCDECRDGEDGDEDAQAADAGEDRVVRRAAIGDGDI